MTKPIRLSGVTCRAALPVSMKGAASGFNDVDFHCWLVGDRVYAWHRVRKDDALHIIPASLCVMSVHRSARAHALEAAGLGEPKAEAAE